MKYEHKVVLKSLCIQYQDDAFAPLIEIMLHAFVYNFFALLDDADELIFQQHPGASMPMLITMLKDCKKTSSVDEFRSYLDGVSKEKRQQVWLNHKVLVSFYSRLRMLHHFLHGSWEEIEHQVLTNEVQINQDGCDISLFRKPEKDCDVFIGLTHQITWTHLQKFIRKFSSVAYIKRWFLYDPSLELEKLVRSEQGKEFALDIRAMVTRMCKEMKSALEATEVLFEQRRKPETYVFILRMLALTSRDHQSFDTDFQTLCEDSSVAPGSKEATKLGKSLEWLRLASRFHLPSHILEPVPRENHERFSKAINRLVFCHIESVKDRLESAKKFCIERTGAGFRMRLEALPSSAHKEKEGIARKHDEFLEAQKNRKFYTETSSYAVRSYFTFFSEVTPPIQPPVYEVRRGFKRPKHA